MIGLILSIVACIAIILDLVDKITLLAIFIGIYELVYNYINIKKEGLLICFGLIVLLIIGDIVSIGILKQKELLFILGIIVISDVFQELSGKYFGKNKIGWVSPNKTYEGYIGGYIGVIILYFIKSYNFFDVNLIFILGVIGDLFFSFIKRKIGIKDYSGILLSHGGMLDRTDSYFMAVLGYGLYKILNQ